MTRRFAIVATAVAAAWVLGSSAPASAQKMYKWTDKDGKVHFSNVSPEGNATAVESDSSPAGVEARSPESPSSDNPTADAIAAGASAPAPAASSGGSGSSGDSIADEAFSTKASSTRLRLKRELASAKEQAQAANDKLDALRADRSKPKPFGYEAMMAAYDPKNGEAQEDALRKEKETADKKVEDIRKQYADLHAEAVKRLGSEPSWWLPLD